MKQDILIRFLFHLKVKHFDRKREYLKFKDRIQNEGYEPENRAPN